MTGKLGICLYYIGCVLQLSRTVLPYHIDSEHVVDLLQYVVLEPDDRTSPTLLLTMPGANNHSTAYVFQGSSRQVEVATEAVHSLQKILETNEEFTILVLAKQHINNTGSIITFSIDNERYLELESSGRKNEIRLYYYPHPPGYHDNARHIHTQTFPYHFADGNWHKLAISISTHFIQLFIDCQKVYERQISSLDTSHLSKHRNIRLWLGQRSADQAHFKGAIEYVKIVLQPQGHHVQCPSADTPCPTCRQYYQLENNVEELYKVIAELSKKLINIEKRLSDREQCECMSSCLFNGTRYRDGESWQKDACITCTCRGGDISCMPPKCPVLKCKHPAVKGGDCCPSCLRHCYYSGKTYEHLEEHYPRECIKCTCRNGRMTCHREEQCPLLDCVPDQQVSVEGKCCKFCKGVDYCSQGSNCHSNARCYNLDTKYTCQCNDGYVGDGTHCQDLDECLYEGGLHGHHCHRNTKCVNSLGSYECQCLPGYARESHFACRELDECHLGLHDCHPNAECINSEGSFMCYCSSGYHGDGQTCNPTCRESCENGGSCIAPDTCSCREGYLGNLCQTDYDECSTGVAKCHPHSSCVNIPGRYYCQCKKGYHSHQADNVNGLLCQDINECDGWGAGHQCPSGTECMNTPGGYECFCRQQEECTAACQVDGEYHANGTVWDISDGTCSQCRCQEGVTRCSRRPCDCADGFSDPKCCPQCEPHDICHHQKLPITYYNGDTWIYQCQMCECLRGEVDCWALDCPSLSCSKVVHEEGDCCPRCVEEDPCLSIPGQDSDGKHSLMSMMCFFGGKKYYSGQSWLVSWDICSACTCQAGQICCTYNETCARLRQARIQSGYLPEHVITNAEMARDTDHYKNGEIVEYSVGESKGEEQLAEDNNNENHQVNPYYKNWNRGGEEMHSVHDINDPGEENLGHHSGHKLHGGAEADDGEVEMDRSVDVGQERIAGVTAEDNAPDDNMHNNNKHMLHAVDIPGRSRPQRLQAELQEYAPSLPRSRKHTTGEAVSRQRSNNGGGMHTDTLHGLHYPTNSRSTDVETSSAVLSQDAGSSGGRRRGSRKQGRRNSRRLRARLRAASTTLGATKDLSVTSPRRDRISSLLETELQGMRPRTHSSTSKDWRDKTSGRRRQSFDGGG